jgi:hypothetical protein
LCRYLSRGNKWQGAKIKACYEDAGKNNATPDFAANGREIAGRWVEKPKTGRGSSFKCLSSRRYLV